MIIYNLRYYEAKVVVHLFSTTGKGVTSTKGKGEESFSILNSRSYLYLLSKFSDSFSGLTKDSTTKLDPSVYHSLQNYEKQISTLKFQVKLLTFQLGRELRGNAFYKTLVYTKDQQINAEPLTEDELSQLQSLLNSEHATKNNELVELVEDKVEN
jgi:hypothetical protein